MQWQKKKHLAIRQVVENLFVTGATFKIARDVLSKDKIKDLFTLCKTLFSTLLSAYLLGLGYIVRRRICTSCWSGVGVLSEVW